MVESAIIDFGQLVHCPFCHAVLRNRPTMAWQMARCPTCQNQFVMPGTAQSPIAQPVDTIGPAHWATAAIQEPLPPIEEPEVPCQIASPRENQPATRPDLAAARSATLPVASPATAATVPQHIVQAVQTASAITAEAAPLPPQDAAELAKLATEPETEQSPWSLREQMRNAPAWVISLMMHTAVIIVLGMFTLAAELDEYIDLEMSWHKPEATSLEDTAFKIDVEDPEPVTNLAITQTEALEAEPFAAPPEMAVTPLVGLQPQFDFTAANIGMALDGRDEAGRMTLVAKYGGTKESEAAVGKGLEWLKNHQLSNGSWHFDHSRGPQCRGKCRHPGGSRSETGSTALALLPFLGAGQTHEEGKYQTTVRRGLYYLANQVRKNGGPRAGDLQGGRSGNMYCHGLASIALCEAYAMTQDKGLKFSAQQSLNFIVYAQDHQAPRLAVGHSQAGMGFGIVRPEADGFLKGLDGFLLPAQLGLGQAQVVVGFGVIRLEGDGLLKVADGLPVSTQLRLGHPQRAVYPGAIRFDLQSAIKLPGSFVNIPRCKKIVPELAWASASRGLLRPACLKCSSAASVRCRSLRIRPRPLWAAAWLGSRPRVWR